jgi:crotonobetainyl-CoA:carnitine CoA-transferase CaiB-like acyl-CoA transferase
MADIFADPHVAARQMIAAVEIPGNAKPIQIAAQALKFTTTPANVYRTPPLLNQHRTEILAELGLAAATEAP